MDVAIVVGGLVAVALAVYTTLVLHRLRQAETRIGKIEAAFNAAEKKQEAALQQRQRTQEIVDAIRHRKRTKGAS